MPASDSLHQIGDAPDAKLGPADPISEGGPLVSVLDAIDDGIALFSPEGRLIACSRAYAAMWRDWGFRLTKNVTSQMLTEHLQKAGDILLDGQATCNSATVETFARSTDKTKIVSIEQQFRSGQWHRIKLSHHPDGSVIVVRSDISALKHYGEEVQTLLQRNVCLAGAFNSTSVGVIIVDATAIDMPIVMVNPAFLSVTGYAKEEVLGRNCRFLQGAGTDPATIAAFAQAIADQRSMTGEILNYRRDGSELWFELSLSPIFNDQGKLTHYVGLQTDITQRLASEAALRQAQKMESLGLLVSGIAHDFNNLLAALSGGAEQLCEIFPETEDAGVTARLVLAAAHRAAELTQSLVSFSRQQKLRPDVLDLPTIVDGLTMLLTRTLGATFVIERDFPDALWPICVDRAQLETSLVNLAINARDAMQDGGILRIGARNLPKGGDQESDQIEINVTDTGSGMTEDVRQRVCEPFFTTKEVGKGTGLGLSMVFGFIQQSGGRLHISSKPGEGTTVSLYLPRAEKPICASEAHNPKAAMEGGHETILVTDDDPLVRSITVRLLRRLGYATAEASNSDEALRILATAEQIDLLLSDVLMPGLRNGYQLAHEAMILRPGLKILMMTGNASAHFPAELRKDDFPQLAKPFSNTTLAAQVRAILDGDLAA